MYIEDKDIHKGHRARMRSKLESYGPRIFDTYELLEMLLYYVIPYRDTNPIAKRLLAAFGSLALRRAGATIEGEAVTANHQITKQDLMELGLSGGADASAKRLKLLKKLDLPEHMSPNAMLQALNLLMDLQELKLLMNEQ